MIKLTFALVRRPEFTRESFQDYWFNTHAPLVASVREPLRIRRYVQMHSLPAEISEGLRTVRGGPEGYDGVAQLWWDSFEDLAASADDEAAKAAGRLLLEDEQRFIDLSRSPLWWGEERVIF
ncbi:EthD domain-containing protein [Phenylobacterium sp. Root700]|uniref:EthD domain-containing protein n=1 Tax=Phenylobacterium sp. Root700 TaxID=1736591 RepID=UPI0006F375DF|nr:EthD domain-containing protein [Phenylobacterium sp. Root700]KRB48885.1 ethyl tert-butyl ether degradation protein EthD [Phenylobacterium sp. Root700]